MLKDTPRFDPSGARTPTSGSGVRGINHQTTALPYKSDKHPQSFARPAKQTVFMGIQIHLKAFMKDVGSDEICWIRQTPSAFCKACKTNGLYGNTNARNTLTASGERGNTANHYSTWKFSKPFLSPVRISWTRVRVNPRSLLISHCLVQHKRRLYTL